MSYRRALALAAVLTAAPGWADEPAKKGPRVTVWAYEEEGGEKLAEPVEAALGEALSGDARLDYRPMLQLLEPPDEAPRALGEADIMLHDAEQAFSEMDLEKCKDLLKKAILTYQKYIPQLAQRGGGLEPLRDAWIKLSKVRFFDGDQNGSRDALRYAFVVDPKLTFSPKLFPPQMKKAVVEARLLFEALGPGKLVFDSDPQGATVFLNGVQVPKTTPTDPVEAPPGPNFISYRRRGYAQLTAIFENNGGGEQATASQSLSRYPNNPIAPLQRARQALERNDSPPHLKEAAEKLQVDMLLLVRFSTGAQVTISAFLYDARPDKIVNRIIRQTPEEQAPETAREIARMIFTDVPLDGSPLKPPSKAKKRGITWAEFSSKARDDFKRFYAWKGFWYVVGGVGGAIVLSAVIGGSVAADQQQKAAQSVILFGGN